MCIDEDTSTEIDVLSWITKASWLFGAQCEIVINMDNEQ